MAKQSPGAPRSKPSPPSSTRSNQPRDWRRAQGPGWGSWWNLLWRQKDDRPGDLPRQADPKRRQYVFRVRLGAAAVTVLVLIAFIVWIVSRGDPAQTSLVAVTVADYDFPIPPNAYVLEDLQGFHSFGQREQGHTDTNVRLVGKTPGERDHGAKILDELRDSLSNDPNCRPGGPKNNVLLVYLSAHGVVNEKGEACLLQTDSDPLDSSTWVPFKSVLDELRDNKKLAGYEKLYTVLLLDCSKSPDEWQLGQLYNSFVARLDTEVQRFNHPRLVVISSAGPGQTAFTAPALGGSVFGFFLKVGLGGAASGDGNTVTISELMAYLTKHMAAWTKTHHDVEQTPAIFPKQSLAELKNIKLTYASGDNKSAKGRSLAPERELARRKDQIDRERTWVKEHCLELAQRYREQTGMEQISEQGVGSLHPASLDPITWGRLRQKLVNLDRLLLAGEHFHQAGSNVFGAEHGDVQKLLRDLRKPPADWTKSALSFHLLEQCQRGQATPGGKTAAENGGLKTAWEKLLKSAASDAGVKRDQLKLPEPLVTPTTNRPADVEQLEVQWLKMLTEYPLDEPGVERELGPAILAREQAERAAAPADVRASHWIADLVDAADQQRRLAEDWLVVGSSESLVKAARNWPHLPTSDEKQGKYQVAQSLATKVSNALRARDRAWADALHMAGWTLSRKNPRRNTDVAKFRKWLSGLRTLSAELHRPHAGEFDAVQEVDKLAALEKALSVSLSEWIPSYSQTRLSENAEDMDDSQARQIELLLYLPPLDPTTSKALHANDDRRAKYVDHLFDRVRPASEKAGPPTEDDSAAVEQAYRETLWNNTLALDCLLADQVSDERGQPGKEFPATAEGDQVEGLAKRGGRLRQALRQAGKTAADLKDKAMELLVLGNVTANPEKEPQLASKQERELALNVRKKLSEADLGLRAAAPLLPVQPPADLAQHLARLDALTEFIWHARRVIDDFWGPWPAGSKPYFSLAARKYLEGAETAWPDQQQVQLLSGSVKALLERRLRAADPQSGGVLPWPFEANQSTEGKYTQRIELLTAGDVPVGEAAVFVRRYGTDLTPLRVFAESEKDAREHRRWPVSVLAESPSAEPKSAVISQRFDKSDLAGVESLQAVSLFRGHLRPRDFLILRPGQGETVAFERSKLGPPRITVSGYERHSKVVLFIFDCSASMCTKVPNANLPAEARRIDHVTDEACSRFNLNIDPDPTNPENKEARRILVAKYALSRILEELPDESFLVGLWAYGHRAGWYPEGKGPGGDVIRYSSLLPAVDVTKMEAAFALGKGPRPPFPSNDVEQLLKPARLDDNLRGAIRGKLMALQPHGETPLLYAISEAFDELANRYADVPEKQIVVLTDGFDYQYPKTDFFDDAAKRKAKGLLTLLRDRPTRYGKIRLDIVGFDLGQPTPDEKSKRDELEAIASVQHGKFRPATSLKALITELNDSIVLPLYRIQPESARDTFRDVRLGKTWLADEDWKLPAGESCLSYVVSLPAQKDKRLETLVDLEGGEALKLIYTPRGLEHEFYNPKETRRFEAESAVVGRPYHVTAFVPKRLGQGVEFSVAIQHNKEMAHQFTGRPRHVWADIEPTGFDGNPPEKDPPIFHCYDPEFESGTPKPVLRFVVSKWPAGARKAKLKLWFRGHEDQDNPRSVTLRWERSEVEKNLQAPSEALQGVTFDVQTTQPTPGVTVVNVTENHKPGQPRELVLRVQMTPPPDKGHHSYFAGKTRQVQHNFVFFGTRPEKIEVTTRDDIQRGALTLPEGKALELTLPD